MKKNSRRLNKRFRGQRGLIAGTVLFITGALSLVAVIGLASIMAKVTYGINSGYAAVYAAQVCRDWTDSLQLYSGNVDAGCTIGKAIDKDSTSAAVTCVNPGETATKTVGDCTCDAVIVDATPATSYGMAFTGVCGSAGRTDTADKYTVTINTNISKCPTCTQLCTLPPLGLGATCGDTACGLICNECCAAGLVDPPCSGTPPTCQNP